MQRKLLTLSLSMVFAAGLFAQSRVAVPAIPVKTQSAHTPSSRAMTCTADTLNYALVKEELIGTGSYNAAYLQGPGEIESQAYISPGTVSIVGVSFQARVNIANPSASVPTMVYIYTVNASYMPVAKVDSALVTVSTVTPMIYNVNFATPVSVTGNYALAIRPTTAFKIDFIANNADVTPSYGEALSYTKFDAGSGSQWYLNSDPLNWGQDFDALISPVVTYTINTDFLVSPSTSPVCLGTPLVFSNVTTPSGLLASRMYNFNTFLTNFGLAASDSTYAWDMGDGSPLIWSSSTSYTYPAAGTDTATLITLGGFWSYCIDTKSTILNITPNAVASFTANSSASPLIAFTSTSTGAATYAWDFGDGSPVDNSMNPSHTYASPGTYTVTLTVTSAGGCNTDVFTQTVTILATGISGNAMATVSVYPNPSNGVFTVNVGAAAKASLRVYNVLGAEVLSQQLNGQSGSVDMSGFDQGVYFLEISTGTDRITKKITLSK